MTPFTDKACKHEAGVTALLPWHLVDSVWISLNWSLIQLLLELAAALTSSKASSVSVEMAAGNFWNLDLQPQ